MNTFEVVGYLSNSRTEKTIVIEDITHEREAMDYAAMFHNIDEIISIKPGTVEKGIFIPTNPSTI